MNFFLFKVSVPIVPDIINMDLGRTVKFMDEQKAELSKTFLQQIFIELIEYN